MKCENVPENMMMVCVKYECLDESFEAVGDPRYTIMPVDKEIAKALLHSRYERNYNGVGPMYFGVIPFVAINVMRKHLEYAIWLRTGEKYEANILSVAREENDEQE